MGPGDRWLQPDAASAALDECKHLTLSQPAERMQTGLITITNQQGPEPSAVVNDRFLAPAPEVFRWFSTGVGGQPAGAAGPGLTPLGKRFSA